MKHFRLSFLVVAMAALCSGLVMGCSDSDKDNLPANPVIDNPSGRSAQMWYFGYKDYDRTFRIRWPTYFTTARGVGPGSYTLVNGERAEFRSYDTDRGAQRASYTIAGPENRFTGEVLCVLYSADGQALGWFRTVHGAADNQGSLP